eukprot:3653548-Amphidinium_carterae.1
MGSLFSSSARTPHRRQQQRPKLLVRAKELHTTLGVAAHSVVSLWKTTVINKRDQRFGLSGLAPTRLHLLAEDAGIAHGLPDFVKPECPE